MHFQVLSAFFAQNQDETVTLRIFLRRVSPFAILVASEEALYKSLGPSFKFDLKVQRRVAHRNY